MGSDRRQPAWDCDLECRHGRMPFDPSDVCGCFPVEFPGYGAKEPVVIPFPTCGCGCGERPSAGKRFVIYHAARVQHRSAA